MFKLAFSVKKVTGDVDAANTAVAFASCTDCRTVAVAIQVVLVSGDVDSATPENVAVAVNYHCTECETLARAFQFVYGNGEELEFTKEGKQRLHKLKKQVHDLKHRDDLTLAELNQELAVITAEVADVVETETQVKQANGPPAGRTATTSTTATSTTVVLTASTTVAGSTTTSTVATTTTVPTATTTTGASTTTIAGP